MHLVNPCTRPGRVRVKHPNPTKETVVLGRKEQRAEQTLQPAAGHKHKVQPSQSWERAAPAHTLLKDQGQPQEALPDQLPKFTVTPAPPAPAGGPGKEFGWGRTWISPVPAVPAQAAPEGSTEPSLVTNSIKTHPGKKGLAQSEPNTGRIPSSVSPGCQPRGFGDMNTGRGINNLQTFKNWVWHWSTPQNQHQGFKPEAQF